MARRYTFAALLCLLAAGVWGLQQMGVPGGDPPPGRGIPEEPDAPRTTLETAVPTDLEVAIEVVVRARILPEDPAPRFFLVRGAAMLRAQVTLLTPLDGPALVEFALQDGRRLYRVLGPEHRDAVTVVDTELRGRAVDATGRPVAGARVWFGQGDPGRDDPVTTDAEGRFRVASVAGGEGVPVVVSAKGLASSFRVMDVDGSAKEPVFVLEEGAALSVQLAADVMDGSRARVFLAPADMGDSRLQGFPFFLAAIAEGWRTDARGDARIEGLPAGSRVEVVVHHPAAFSTRSGPVKVRTGARVVVPVRRRARWTGRVTDPRGEPLAGVSVTSRLAESPPRRHGGRGLPSEVDSIGVCAGRTDATGTFTVARGELLRITAVGRAGLEMRPGDDRPLEVTLFEPRAGEPALRFVIPDCRGSYRVRCRPYGNEWRMMACGQHFERVLPDRALVDLVVRLRQGGVVREPRVFTGLAVQDLTEVDLR